mmetsp:Transcript_67762/g.159515  ORF Transcript_67762/g.159515 Transcript_67762/m.159515 type:complete len:155 (-) Transcript_67762:224-688(-)
MGCQGSKAKAAPMAETRPDPEDAQNRTDAEHVQHADVEAGKMCEAAVTSVDMEVSADVPCEHEKHGAVNEVMEPPAVEAEVCQDVPDDVVPKSKVLEPEGFEPVEVVKSLQESHADDLETVTTAPKEDDSIVPGTEDKLEDAREFPLCSFCRGW